MRTEDSERIAHYLSEISATLKWITVGLWVWMIFWRMAA